MENVLLFGGGNQASYCIDIVEKESRYKIVGVVDSLKEVGSVVCGYPVVGRQEQTKQLILSHGVQAGIITIGDNWSRSAVYDCVKEAAPEFRFVNAIHPTVTIGKDVEMGFGVVAMAGCIVNPGCRVGNFCFFATGAQLEHDCRMGDFSSISAGVVTGGRVSIGRYSAITLGVTIMDRLTIGENTVVGSGSLVTRDLPDNVLAYGSPARIIRERKSGERFLRSN